MLVESLVKSKLGNDDHSGSDELLKNHCNKWPGLSPHSGGMLHSGGVVGDNELISIFSFVKGPFIVRDFQTKHVH